MSEKDGRTCDKCAYYNALQDGQMCPFYFLEYCDPKTKRYYEKKGK